MSMFVLGLCLFFGIHVITVTPALRRAVSCGMDANPWRGVVALCSAVGIVLICTGWGRVPDQPLFAPSVEAVRAAPYLVPLAFVLFVIGGFGFKGHIRRTLHHPMLMGVALWAGVHLAANGGSRETLLFGLFLAYALYALGVVFGLGKRADFAPAIKWDLAGLAIGLFVAVGVMHSHRILFGVAVG